jgi:hypothetical protein
MTIAKLERGVQEPAWPLSLVLAEALGVSCLAFIGDAGSKPATKREHGRPSKATPAKPPPGMPEAEAKCQRRK